MPAGLSQEAFLEQLAATEGVESAVPNIRIELDELTGPEPRCLANGVGAPADAMVYPGVFTVSTRWPNPSPRAVWDGQGAAPCHAAPRAHPSIYRPALCMQDDNPEWNVGQYNLAQVGAMTAWKYATSALSTSICIMDTGARN